MEGGWQRAFRFTILLGLAAMGIVMLIPVNFEVYKSVLFEGRLIGNGNFNTCKGR
jgi:hypothetical protein